MLELEEADLEGVEVLEGLEEELHLHSLALSCCHVCNKVILSTLF